MFSDTTVFEIIGTIAFAVSGAMTAVNKKLDIFGVAILGLTTACGGGIMRDVMAEVTPFVFVKHFGASLEPARRAGQHADQHSYDHSAPRPRCTFSLGTAAG